MTRTVIYRTDDPEQKGHWRPLALSYVVGSLSATAVIVAAGALVGEGLAIAALFVAAVVFLIAYVVWRRRRNRASRVHRRRGRAEQLVGTLHRGGSRRLTCGNLVG
jgi:Flp pilus assembly protein TadB